MNATSPFRALAALSLCAALAAAQGAPSPKVAPAAPTPNPDMKSRLILVQHASPYLLHDLLRPMLSGAPGSTLDAMDKDGIRALAVRDFPENLAAIEEAVKRLDTEVPARKQVEFHVHVLFASKEGDSGPVPDELKEVLDSLKATLAYRSYTVVASFVQRAADGAENVEDQGQAQMAARSSKGEAQNLDLRWGLYHLALSKGADGKVVITVPKFELTAYEATPTGQGRRLASLETNLAIKDGEKVVVGTSMIRDKALVVVVTAKVED